MKNEKLDDIYEAILRQMSYMKEHYDGSLAIDYLAKAAKEINEIRLKEIVG